MTAEYNISLAVQILRTLFFEKHSNEDCTRFVWRPIQFWLQRLVEEHPTELTCLHGKLLPDEKSRGYSSDVFLVVPKRQIIYLGTVLTRIEAQDKFQWFKATFPERIGDLRKRGWTGIIRWWAMCIIPVDTTTLTDETIGQGVQKYLGEFAPSLANIPIYWLSPDQQQDICLEITQQAILMAKHQTREEKLDIISENF